MTEYKQVFIPTLTYAAESWPSIEKFESYIQATKMNFLRKALFCKIRFDQIKNKRK